MATVNLSPLFNGQTVFGPTGLPLAGGQIYTYQAGSSTPLTTYTTFNGNIANTNPIILGSDGKLPQEVWLQYGYSYKFIVEDANSVIIDTYDNIAGIITQIPAAVPTIPSGCIVIWSGSVGSVPSGWNLCDGTNGTPDLRNSFILGAGNSYTVGQTGGSTDAIVVTHTHTATSSVSDPGHNHSVNFNDPGHNHLSNAVGLTQSNINWVGAGGGGYNNQNNTYTGNAQTGISVSNNPASTGITVGTSNAYAGQSGAGANMPPYFALAYIMKL
jgi:hypothetical protein